MQSYNEQVEEMAGIKADVMYFDGTVFKVDGDRVLSVTLGALVRAEGAAFEGGGAIDYAEITTTGEVVPAGAVPFYLPHVVHSLPENVSELVDEWIAAGDGTGEEPVKVAGLTLVSEGGAMRLEIAAAVN